MSKKKKHQNGKQLSQLEEALKQKENEHQETLKQLSEIEERAKVEKYLKNEAYAFLLAEGLLDKFLEFRERFHRTKAQDALYTLVAEADMGGLWIDLFS